MYDLIRLKDETGRLARSLAAREHALFGTISHDPPRLNPAELGFLRAVTWLFVLYAEVARIGVAFLLEKLPTYHLESAGEHEAHFSVVVKLRTLLQHNLDPTVSHDRSTEDDCRRWFSVHCGTAVPADEEHWRACLVALLKQGLQFIRALQACLRSIERDESREAIVRQWTSRLETYHAPHEFDDIVREVALDMGRDAIDPIRLRKRYYDRWMEQLSQLQLGYNFETEARRVIEATLLTEILPVLPITGRDVMDALGIGPGPRVGEVLARARGIYLQNPCSREELLARLLSLDAAAPASTS